MAASRPRRGIVSGYLLKLIRESIPASQEQLAERLGVDRGTIQGWETGRRPLTAIPVAQMTALRHRLARLGASTALIGAMDRAADADYLLAQILDTDPAGPIDAHPLGWSVMNHGLTDMISWAVSGAEPRIVRHSGHPTAARRGPVPAGPDLDAGDRRRFFEHLRVIADRAGERDVILLHRQACYLGSLDRTRDATAWITPPGRFPHFHRAEPWSPRWVDARSVATSLARQGDRQPLHDFIAHAHADDTSELAGLTYWAYWVGEIDQHQPDDSFMVDRSLRWRGTALLRHIVDRLDAGHAFIDLNIHTLWALLQARPGLAHDDPDTTALLIGRGERLMDEGGISDQSRHELTSVLYGLRVQGFTEKGPSDDDRS